MLRIGTIADLFMFPVRLVVWGVDEGWRLFIKLRKKLRGGVK